MATSRASIFISYRRDPATSHFAGRLAASLIQRFGFESVFLDVVAIPPGQDFIRKLEDTLAACITLLALIGDNWIDVTNQQRRKLDDPDDPVMLEITTALNRDIAVIPVLIDGTHMPAKSALRHALRPLTQLQAVHVRHETFATDITRLHAALDRIPNIAATKRDTRPPKELTWHADALSTSRNDRTLRVVLTNTIHQIVIARRASHLTVTVDGQRPVQSELDDNQPSLSFPLTDGPDQRLAEIEVIETEPRWHPFTIDPVPLLIKYYNFKPSSVRQLFYAHLIRLHVDGRLIYSESEIW